MSERHTVLKLLDAYKLLAEELDVGDRPGQNETYLKAFFISIILQQN